MAVAVLKPDDRDLLIDIVVESIPEVDRADVRNAVLQVLLLDFEHVKNPDVDEVVVAVKRWIDQTRQFSDELSLAIKERPDNVDVD